MIQIDKERLAKFESITLLQGAHPANDGMCAMEAAAYLAGEQHSDKPECVSTVIAAFMRKWNDDLDDVGRQRLKPYVVKVLGTRGSAEDEQRRGWMCADWLVRHHTPAWLELAGLKEQATALRAVAELIDLKSLEGARPAIAVAKKSAAAAGAAAWAAAGAAAGDAAGDAAWAAAWDRLALTRLSLQDSALELLERMIAVGADAREAQASA